MDTPFQSGQTILFQGDSITDCGRSREDLADLGRGYARIVASLLGARFPELDLTVINRGISGNRAKDLRGRWEEDCLALKPDWVSILIGVNDCWRAFDQNDPTTVESYEADYREILTQVRDKLNARLVVCEPFLLPVPADREAWRVDLDPKIHVARKLAREFDAIFVPFDGLFAAASCRQRCGYWAADGVHPTPAGHGLMAEAWIKAVLG